MLETIASDQIAILFILAMALFLFIQGRMRFDFVALLSLFLAVALGLIPFPQAFTGFSHAAVITVACVLIISKSIRKSGIIERIGHYLNWTQKSVSLQILVLCLIVAFCSAFMNNVGALALLMPLALQQSIATERSPSLFLMPMAFASLLGGLGTLIGTPPNIIISKYRATLVGEPFHFFDFSPIGVAVALAGILFMALIGWRLIPLRRRARSAEQKILDIEEYVVEAQISEKSSVVGKNLWAFEALAGGDVVVIGLVRGQTKAIAPAGVVPLQADDILILEGDPEALKKIIAAADLNLITSEGSSLEKLSDGNATFSEVVVAHDSPVIGSTTRDLHFRTRFGINMLALSRQGKPIMERLGNIQLRAGDVLLLQGESDLLHDAMTPLGCLPLAERDLGFGNKERRFLPTIFFLLAIVATTMGVAPVEICLFGAVMGILLVEGISLNEAYKAIEWPIIILLGAMIPVGEALESTGTSMIIAQSILSLAHDLSPIMVLGVLMFITMGLTDIINNAAAAVLMAPIAGQLAQLLHVNPDSFLIATCIACSSAFLTPIGHQSNTLVMGPGGYKFGDYWRMGICIQILILAITLPLVQIVWPLTPVMP